MAGPPNWLRGVHIKPHAPVFLHEVKPETRLKQARALELRAQGYSFQRMADDMGISKLYARKLYLQAMAAIITPGVEEMRTLENERLDIMQQHAMEILTAFHPYVSSGSVVRTIVEDSFGRPLLDADGEVVTQALGDAGPRLAAIKVLLAISDRRAKLNGLDAPTKVANTDPTGNREAGQQLVQFYLPDNGRDDTVVSEQ